jgi:hypothetical protein
VFQKHRLPLTGSRWNIRWVIGRRTKPTLCVFFSVFLLSVAVMGKCSDACGDEVYYFRPGFSASEGAGVQWHRLPLTGSRWDLRWVIGRRTKPTFSELPVFSVAVMGKCCDDCGDRGYLFSVGIFGFRGCQCLRSIDCRQSEVVGTYGGLNGRRTKPTLCVIPVFSVAVMEKCCDTCGDGEYYLRSGFSASDGAGV